MLTAEAVRIKSRPLKVAQNEEGLKIACLQSDRA